MANYFSSIFTKLNLERNYLLIDSLIISLVLCLKYLEKYNCAWMNQINLYTYSYKNIELFLNYNVEILQLEILYIYHG